MEVLTILPIIDRIRAECPQFKAVKGAAEYETAVTSGSVANPSAFVIYGTERANVNKGGSEAHIQNVRADFGVILAIRNYRVDELGTAQAADLETMRVALRQALVGWTHPSHAAATNISFTGGQNSGLKNGTLWWTERFTYNFAIRN